MNILESLLRLVAEGGLHSDDDLARRLSVTPPLLEVMIEDLARLGYLRAMGSPPGQGESNLTATSGGQPCESHCSPGACPGGGCTLSGSLRYWTLTDKGARAAARLSE